MIEDDYRLPDTATRSHFMATPRLGDIWWHNRSSRPRFMWSSYGRASSWATRRFHYAREWVFWATLDISVVELRSGVARCGQNITIKSLQVAATPPSGYTPCPRCWPDGVTRVS